MKKIITILLIGFISQIFVACNQVEPENSVKELYIGHISIENNTLYLDEVEWITNEDKDRITELELQQSDMPNGYYIHYPGTETLSFEIDKVTEYHFIALEDLSFMTAGQDRNYSTSKKEEFMEYINAYSDKAATVPFWIEVKNGTVISITEQFVN